MRTHDDCYKKESDFYFSAFIISIMIPISFFAFGYVGYDIFGYVGYDIFSVFGLVTLPIICLLWLIWGIYYDKR